MTTKDQIKVTLGATRAHLAAARQFLEEDDLAQAYAEAEKAQGGAFDVKQQIDALATERATRVGNRSETRDD